MQIAVDVPEKQNNDKNIMGADLGLKAPAAAVTSNGKTKFFGNGRQNKYIRCKYKPLRQKLGKAKQLKKIIQIGSKAQRTMLLKHLYSNNIALLKQKNDSPCCCLMQYYISYKKTRFRRTWNCNPLG